MSNQSLNDNELLENLKKEADMYGISYNHRSTVNSLTKKIRAFQEASDSGIVVEKNPATRTKTEEQKKQSIVNSAKRLKRVEITCNDPKIRVRGQIFRSISNQFVSVRKVIPLESPTFVPEIILNNLKESKYLTFVKKTVKGHETSVAKEVPTYNIRELDPLTKEDFERIAVRQQANSAIGDDY